MRRLLSQPKEKADIFYPHHNKKRDREDMSKAPGDWDRNNYWLVY